MNLKIISIMEVTLESLGLLNVNMDLEYGNLLMKYYMN